MLPPGASVDGAKIDLATDLSLHVNFTTAPSDGAVSATATTNWHHRHFDVAPPSPFIWDLAETSVVLENLKQKRPCYPCS